jgi:hypothetical protein
VPTATLTYDLSDPDEAGQHRLAISAIHLSAALHSIDEFCRATVNYGSPSDDVVSVLDQIRDMMPDDMWEY